jgi:hypothetical protein
MPQLTRDDLKGMTPEQIVAANQAGDLDEYLGRRAAHQLPAAHVQWTADDVRQATPEQIVQAEKTGQLRDYMNTRNS